MVEVFKTNVQCREESKALIQKLLQHLPHCNINFDLEDCDKILRIEGDYIINTAAITLLNDSGYICELLV